MQKYLTIIIAVLIIYNLLEKTNFSAFKPAKPATSSAKQQEGVKKTEEHIEFEGTWLEKKISKVMANLIKTPEGEKFFQNLVKPIDSLSQGELNYKYSSKDLIKSLFKVNITKPGLGAEVTCGSNIMLNYTLLDLQNNILKQEEKKVTLGSGEISKALENSVIGMRLGEEREVVIYPNLIKDPSINNTLKAKLKLNKINSELNIAEIKSFDDTISFAKPILCGEQVKFDLVVMDVTGKIIFEKQAIKLSLGDETVPPALSHGLFNKTPQGTRTMLAKGRALIGSNSSFAELKKQNIQPNNYYIIELKTTEIVGE